MEVRFRLNPNNPKDLKIIELLENEYDGKEYIKATLYKIACGQQTAISVNQGNLVDTNCYTNALQEQKHNPLNDEFGQLGESEGNAAEEIIDEYAEYFG